MNGTRDDESGGERRPTSAVETVRAYYDALRSGRPLGPFFTADAGLAKVGVFSAVEDGPAVAESLRSQTERTADWTVESAGLRVTERPTHAWFADDVALGWVDVETDVEYAFDTRWTGTLERRAEAPATEQENAVAPPPSPDPDGDWRFVSLHVSAARERDDV